MDKKINSNFFYNWVSTNNKNKKINLWVKLILIFMILIFIIFSFVNVGFKIAPNGRDLFFENLKLFFTFSDNSKFFPDQSLWYVSFIYLGITIKQSLLGTIAGFLIALFTSYLSNKLLVNKFLAFVIGIVTNIFRYLPILMIIFFVELSFTKELGLFIVLLWFTWLWSHKYLVELYKTLDYSAYLQRMIEGDNKFLSFFKTIFYQVRTKIITLFLYSFESNVRWSTILGTLGLIGIGQLIQQGLDDFSIMGIPVFLISVFLILLEIIIYFFKAFFIEKKFLWIKNKNIYLNFGPLRRIIGILLLLSLISFIIYACISSDFNSVKNDAGYVFLKEIFSPDWTILDSSSLTVPIWEQFINLLCQTTVILVIGIFVLLLFLFFGNKFLFKKTYFMIYIFNSLIRSIPTIAFLFIIDSIYFDTSSSIVLALSISLVTNLFKVMSEKFEEIDDYNVHMLFLSGYSKIWIFKNYILYKIKNYIVGNAFFEFENSFRNLIIYGTYGGTTEISSQLNYLFRRSLYTKMGALFWVIFSWIIFINIMLWLVKWFYLGNSNIIKKKVFNQMKKIKGVWNEKRNIIFKSIKN